MANEFINILVGIIGGILIGLVLHSGFRHTYDELLDRLFPKDKRLLCFGRYPDRCQFSNEQCERASECYDKWLTSTE